MKILELLEREEETLEERVVRQFKRYGNEFRREFRCVGGPKDGRLVTSPQKCGIRKDPKKVRLGKKAARIKKSQRIRKSLFTKRKTLSKIVQRRNKMLSKIPKPDTQYTNRPDVHGELSGGSYEAI